MGASNFDGLKFSKKSQLGDKRKVNKQENDHQMKIILVALWELYLAVKAAEGVIGERVEWKDYAISEMTGKDKEKKVTINNLDLSHITPKGGHCELRYDVDNVQLISRLTHTEQEGTGADLREAGFKAWLKRWGVVI